MAAEMLLMPSIHPPPPRFNEAAANGRGNSRFSFFSISVGMLQ